MTDKYRLSEHFHQKEFYIKEPKGNYEKFRDEHYDKMKDLVDTILEPMRQDLEFPIKISSGYRCRTHNIKAKGKANSHHLYNLDTSAVDITGMNDATLQEDLEAITEWLEEKSKDGKLFCYSYWNQVDNFVHISGLTQTSPRVNHQWREIDGEALD